MPNDNTGGKLEWTHDNLEQVISDVYSEAGTDQALHTRLMADPFAVLSSRIELPDEYQGKIIAKDQNAKILVLNVPAYGEARAAIEGTTPAAPTPDYLICTTEPEW